MRTMLLLGLLVGCGSSSADLVFDSGTSPPGDKPDASAAPDSRASQLPSCQMTDPRSVPVELHVQPDEGSGPYVAAIESAKKELRVMVYQMGFGPILDSLKEKAGKGIKVNVILDVSQKDVNQKYFDQLTAAGAEVRWSDPAFTYMHAKAIVADSALSIVSTGNYSNSYILKERNYAMVIRDVADVDTITKIFDADWDRKVPDVSCTRLIVSPVNARPRIIELIKMAKTDLLIESMQFADKEVKEAVLERQKAGVRIRVILANPTWIDANQAAGAELRAAGVEARSLDKPSVHVKAIVVDGKFAYAGSVNLSYTSLTKNREIGLVMSEAPAVTSMITTFESDWALATTF